MDAITVEELSKQPRTIIQQNVLVIDEFLYRMSREDGSIYFPDYQRDLVWDAHQKEMLIDSIVRGIPIGSIFVNESPSFMWEVVDGKQRLDAIYSFTQNEFSYRGTYWKDWTLSMKRGFTFTTLLTHRTSFQTRKEVLELYCRINWAGTLHTVEELERIDAERGGV